MTQINQFKNAISLLEYSDNCRVSNTVIIKDNSLVIRGGFKNFLISTVKKVVNYTNRGSNPISRTVNKFAKYLIADSKKQEKEAANFVNIFINNNKLNDEFSFSDKVIKVEQLKEVYSYIKDHNIEYKNEYIKIRPEIKKKIRQAIQSNDTKKLEELLKTTDNPNEIMDDETKNTLLMFVTQGFDPTCIKLLLDNKQTKVNIKDNNGSTALKILIGAANTETELTKAKKQKITDAIKLFLKKGADIDAESIFRGIAFFDLDCLKLVLKNNSEDYKKLVGREGNILAMRVSNIELLKILVDADNIAHKNKKGDTLLMNLFSSFVKFTSNDDKKALKEKITFLLEKGVDANVINKKGENALSLAAYKSEESMTILFDILQKEDKLPDDETMIETITKIFLSTWNSKGAIKLLELFSVNSENSKKEIYIKVLSNILNELDKGSTLISSSKLASDNLNLFLQYQCGLDINELDKSLQMKILKYSDKK